MIFHIEDRGKLINFRDTYLKELYEIDKERSSQLLETLREYLINDGNILQTSKKLYIHRNTLQYRMDRIKEILNVDISDFNIKGSIKCLYDTGHISFFLIIICGVDCCYNGCHKIG